MRYTFALAAAFVALTAGCALAAPQGKKSSKPAPKKPQTTLGVRGTAQMAGDNGKMGVAYTIGSANDCITFALQRAEYSVGRLLTDNAAQVPTAEEKYLVLHFTLHNSLPRDMTVNGFTLRYTAVDSKDVNRALTGGGSAPLIKEGTNETVNVALKPAQKIAVYTAIKLPADVSVPKLIVQRGTIEPVLRIYFRPGEIKPLPAPFADPSEPSGFKALAEVPVEAGRFYEAGLFDVKLVGTSFVDGKFGTRAPQKGERFVVATLAVRNPMGRPWTLNGFTFTTHVKTDDGEKSRPLSNTALKAQRDEPAGLSLAPGEEYTIRIGVPIPVDAKPTHFYVREGADRRTLVFDASGTQ